MKVAPGPALFSGEVVSVFGQAAGLGLRKAFDMSLRELTLHRIALLFAVGAPFSELSGLRGLAADELVLKSGGVLQGSPVKGDPKSPVYQWVSPSGIQWEIAEKLAEPPKSLSRAEKSYLQKAVRTEDTTAAQWALAQWCYENKLRNRGDQHAQRVIELEPGHEEARRRLRFELVDGEWMTREQKMARQGFFPYKGKYRTQQEIDLLKRDEELSKLEGEWVRPVRTYAKWLQDDKKFEQGRAKLLEIRDAAAAPAIHAVMKKEPNPALRLLYVECLGQIDQGGGRAGLASAALFDEDHEVRLTCVDALKAAPPFHDLIDKFIDGLRHEDVAIVRRAAEALGELGDTAAVEPLIDTLIVSRVEVVEASPHNFDLGFNTSAPNSFGTGGGGFGMGKAPTRKIKHEIRVDECLESLEKITGRNFGYDIEAWKAWHGANVAPEMVDLRRDVK